MSALAMILTAAMVVPGNGPKKDTMEVVDENFPPNGLWIGSIRYENGSAEIEIENGRFRVYDRGVAIIDKPIEIKDEGNGRLTAKVENWTFLGIYKREGGRLIVCYRLLSLDEFGEWPTSFRVNDRQRIATVRYVKSRK